MSIIEEMNTMNITDVSEYMHIKENEAVLELGLVTDISSDIIDIEENTYELKDIPGFEGLYAATEDGRIWSYRRKRFMKPCGEEGNYQIVMLSKDNKCKCHYVHRLVALAWIPNPDNLPEINHKDEHRDHNWSSNLEWCTKEYNLNYGTRSLRIRKPVYCIELDKTFPSIYEAAKEFGGHQANLTSCVRQHQHTFAGYHWRYANE